jgi:hypothetical protein
MASAGTLTKIKLMILLDAMATDGGGAGAELAAPPAEGTEGTEATQGAAATVPAEMLPGCKPGDSYTVKSVDGGNVTLEHQAGAGDGDEGWGEGLTKAAPREEEM